MTTRGPFVPESLDRFADYEEALERLHTRLAEGLERDEVFAAGRHIGLLQETEEVTEEELDILMAYAIYGFRRRDGRTAIETCTREEVAAPEKDEDRQLRLALPSLRFAMLQPREFVPPYGLEVQDLLRDEPFFLFEPYLSELEEKDRDIIFCTWLLALPEFIITNSSLLIMAGARLDDLLHPLEASDSRLRSGGLTAFSQLSPEQQSETIALVIRILLEKGLLLQDT